MTITYHIYKTFVKPFIQAGLEMYRLDATHTMYEDQLLAASQLLSIIQKGMCVFQITYKHVF